MVSNIACVIYFFICRHDINILNIYIGFIHFLQYKLLISIKKIIGFTIYNKKSYRATDYSIISKWQWAINCLLI